MDASDRTAEDNVTTWGEAKQAILTFQSMVSPSAEPVLRYLQSGLKVIEKIGDWCFLNILSMSYFFLGFLHHKTPTDP